MSTAPRHTPWHVNEYDSFDGRHLARILTPSGQEIGRNLSPEHAAFIVLAVNNHEKLLAAAKAMFPKNIRHSKGCDIAKPCRCPVAHLEVVIAAVEGRPA